MGFVCCISSPTVRPRILSIHFSNKSSSSSSSYSPILAFRDARFPEKKSQISLSISSSLIVATLVHASSSSIGETDESVEALSRVSVRASDLLIVGPGVLGRLVAEKWREEHQGFQIYGQTATTNHHEELEKLGINPSLKGTSFADKFPYVIFCAPPSKTLDYAGDLRLAASNWNGEGSFLFTSSSAPYDCFDNRECDEDSPIVPLGKSPKTDVLLKAEKEVLEHGGTVLRLAGLYRSYTYWLRKGIVDACPDHILNLIHYEDAASLAVAIMKKKPRGRIFLGCDNHSLSRQEVMDLVAQSGKYDKKFEAFTGTSGPLGKKLNNSRTRAEIGWEPKYPSFAHFLGVSK